MSPIPARIATVALVLWLLTAPASSGADHYVAVGGSDIGDCESSIAPCETISYALAQGRARAATVRIATGTYVENVVVPTNTTRHTIQGGWSADFSSHSHDPANTVIDGSGGGDVIYARDINASLLVEHLTLANGAAGIDVTNGNGVLPEVTLRSLVIRSNSRGIRATSVAPPGMSLMIENTMLVDNGTPSLVAGGGLTVVSADVGDGATHVELEILNTTISGNQANACGGVHVGASGGVTVLSTLHGTITNSIIWGNTATEAFDGFCIADENEVDVQATYSDIGEVSIRADWFTLGAGTFNLDPSFNSSPGDYHLTSGSVCIDNGTDVDAPVFDFEGTPRPLDGNMDLVARTDIGADEYLPSLFSDGFESGDTSKWSLAVP